MFRFLTAGESHGKALVAVIEGVPAGLDLTAEYIDRDLSRRQKGYGRGGRMKIEQDHAEILSGVRFGKAMGSPIAISITNRDWQAWTDKMSVEPTDADTSAADIWVPRPGHADLPGAKKYGIQEMRNILERASARETATRVAVGAIARRILDEIGVVIASHVVQIGSVSASRVDMAPVDISTRAEDSVVRCLDADAEPRMIAEIDKARAAGDTLGGIFEVVASGLPVGIGSHVHWDRRLDGIIAQAMMSIPAIKGVEIGSGFVAATLPGSQLHDEIGYNSTYFRHTNHAGGLEGGITNGETLVVRLAMKPIPTLVKPLMSVDVRSKEQVEAHSERSDVCAVPAAAVVGEAMLAITLAASVIEQFGGDTIERLVTAINDYTEEN